MTDEVNPESGAPGPEQSGSEPKAPPVSQPPVVAGPEPVSAARMAGRRTVLGVALAIGLVSIIAFAILGYQAFTARLAAAEQLDSATALVEDADAIVVRIDAVVRAKVTPELAEKARETSSEVDEAERLLSEAIELIDAAFLDLNDDERERAELLKDSAEARKEMLTDVPVILTANAQASSALPLIEEGWESVLEADRISDKAVASYNKLTKAGVTESQKLNKQAAAVLATAEERFRAAEDAFPAAPFEDYIGYVKTRIKLNRLSQQSDTAWLKGDLTKANSIITEYNTEDKKAVEEAKKLPATPATAIADAFERVASEATDAYYAKREAALEADEKLRTY